VTEPFLAAQKDRGTSNVGTMIKGLSRNQHETFWIIIRVIDVNISWKTTGPKEALFFSFSLWKYNNSNVSHALESS
jgi:hypothetical protein